MAEETIQEEVKDVVAAEAAAQTEAPAPAEQKKPEAERESAGREEYEERKREAAKRRSDEKRIEAAKRRVPIIEARLEEIEREMFGEAASDYVRAAELDAERERLEEELLGLYELIL